MERTGLDWTLAFGGIIGAIMVLGTILLAFWNREIPSVLTTGDLAVIGFFFTKGITQTLANVMPKKEEEKSP
jgi:hypothetical protein